MKIDKEFKALIPPLTKEEFEQLEKNIIDDGIRDALVVWNDTLIDGHNRFEICEKHGFDYQTEDAAFASRDEAKEWIIRNQFGRRNLSAYDRSILALRLEEMFKAKAKIKKIESGGPVPQKSVKPPIDTQKELAKVAGVSHDTIAKVKTIEARASEPVKQAIRTGELSINKAFGDIRREEKRTEIKTKLESVEVQEAKKIEGVFDVIVIDPPWPMVKIERDERPNQSEFEYPTMTIKEIVDMKIPAAQNCHIWLWTTHKFLLDAMYILDTWKLNYICTFVWHKNGGFQPFNLPQFNCEFALYARIGTPEFIDTKAFFTCFNAPRGKHSEKPQEFYDVVKRVTAGRRLDMFNRRKIDGFIGWGKESK